MTDEELDVIMRHVLVDSLRLDLGAEDDEVTFKPSLQYQRQMKSMLKDPLKWAAQKTHPMWKIIARKAAIILLIISLSFGTVMIGSPTARATFVRWVAEWYETHIVYRYLGESLPDKMPQCRVILSKECKVTSGKTYRLEMVCSINGVEKPSVSVTNTCP